MMHLFRKDKLRLPNIHGRVRRIFPLLIVALLVAHGFILYRVLSRMTFAAILGFIVLVAAKHLGLFGSLHALVRRRAQRHSGEGR